MNLIFNKHLMASILVFIGVFISVNVLAYDSADNYTSNVESKYNITYNYMWNGQWNYDELSYIKVQTIDELEGIYTNNVQYDETFFEKSSLLVIKYGVTSPRYELHVSSVEENEDEVSIVLDNVYIGGVAVEVSSECHIIIEMGKEMLNKNISINLRDDFLLRLDKPYYKGGIENYQLDADTKPYVTKINSEQQLLDYVGEGREEIINKYSDSYFEYGNSLAIINWVEPASTQTRYITSAYDNGEKISLELSTINPKDDGYTVPTPYCAIIPLSKAQADREILLTESMEILTLPEITIDETTGHPGEEIEVIVKLTGNCGFAGLQIDIGFDRTKLTPISIAPGVAINDNSVVSNLQSEMDLKKLNNITAIISNDENFLENGILLTIKFKIADDFNSGNTSVWFNSIKMTNQGLANIEPIVHEGVVNVIDCTMGDINKDGLIDIKDAVLLKQYLYQKTSLSNMQLRAADVNHDGIINESDSDKLEKYLAGWYGIDLNNK